MRTARPVLPSPDASGVERLIAVHIAQRSDATERFGRVPPRSLFDIDRDAEVQDIQRTVAQLKIDTDLFLARHVRKTAWLKYSLAATTIAFLASAGVIVGQHYISSPASSDVSLASKAVAKAPAPLASLQPAAPAPVVAVAVSSPLPAATTGNPVAVVATVAAPPAERAPATPTPLVIDRPVVTVAPPVAKATVAPASVPPAQRVPLSVLPPTVKINATPLPARPIVVAQPPVRPGEHGTASVKPVVAPPRTKPEPAPAKKPPAEDKVFALEAQQGGTVPATSQSRPKPEREVATKTLPAPVVVKASTQHSDKPPSNDASRASVTAASAKVEVLTGADKHAPVSANPPAGAPAKSPTGASTARREKYGAAGVITMTPTGVVVFDRERRAQRMVPIGGQLHDGSILKSIDAKSNRISTDAGDIIFD